MYRKEQAAAHEITLKDSAKEWKSCENKGAKHNIKQKLEEQQHQQTNKQDKKSGRFEVKQTKEQAYFFT